MAKLGKLCLPPLESKMKVIVAWEGGEKRPRSFIFFDVSITLV